MRSRYTAYVFRNVEYLLGTWHASTRPAGIDPTVIPQWCGLQIVRTEAGSGDDDQGVVEFKAFARTGEKVFTLHEVSRFLREDGQWLYVDGDMQAEPSPGARVGKVGRNEPCPCGSGKKFKKCCGP